MEAAMADNVEANLCAMPRDNIVDDFQTIPQRLSLSSV
jgi:hypothetical protein